jgi:hypothetical protein
MLRGLGLLEGGRGIALPGGVGGGGGVDEKVLVGGWLMTGDIPFRTVMSGWVVADRAKEGKARQGKRRHGFGSSLPTYLPTTVSFAYFSFVSQRSTQTLSPGAGLNARIGRLGGSESVS